MLSATSAASIDVFGNGISFIAVSLIESCELLAIVLITAFCAHDAGAKTRYVDAPSVGSPIAV